jgi:hypothetical protein
LKQILIQKEFKLKEQQFSIDRQLFQIQIQQRQQHEREQPNEKEPHKNVKMSNQNLSMSRHNNKEKKKKKKRKNPRNPCKTTRFITRDIVSITTTTPTSIITHQRTMQQTR